jgi:CPA2 family monovalent cation:H+ antiporter-2
MPEGGLILTLTGSLAAALLCGYVTLRLGLSPIVGYLLAGLVVGPHTPGFIANRHLADELAEIGVILLLFGVGLQFHFEELRAVGRVAVPGALFLTIVATACGAIIGAAYGWGWAGGLVFGVALSIASTVVLFHVLTDRGDLRTPAGHLAVGWLVVEDVLTVFVLVLLPGLLAPGKDAGAAAVTLAVLVALLKLIAMGALTYLLGKRVVPWILERAAVTRSGELFTLTVLVLALGIAVASVRFFGVSMALGAFLAGMVVGRTEFSLRAATEALPMRDAFAVLFFVSVGMLFPPGFLLESPGLVAWTVAVVLLVKPVVACAVVLLLGNPLRTAVCLGLATAQIGEFSFILATAGERLGLLDEQARNALIVAAIVSISVNPLLYRLVAPVETMLQRFMKRAGTSDGGASVLGAGASVLEPGTGPSGGFLDRAVIVGYGPVGRTLARLLRDNGIEPVILEMNLQTVRRLKAEGTAAFHGDAMRRTTLETADVARAVALVLSSASSAGMGETIRHARELNPKLLILARTSYLRESGALRRAGADAVFSGEGEVAMAMIEFVLRRLGTTPVEIDRQRQRLRRDLFPEIAAQDTLRDVRRPPDAGEDTSRV